MSTVPAVPQRRPQSKRHSTATLALARTMYGGGDSWTPTEIARYLHEQGTPVSVSTVKRWVIPGYAEQHRVCVQQRARAKRLGEPVETDRQRVIRIGLLLRSRGMSYSAISLALEVFEGIHRTPGSLRGILREAGAAPDTRRQNLMGPGNA